MAWSDPDIADVAAASRALTLEGRDPPAGLSPDCYPPGCPPPPRPD